MGAIVERGRVIGTDEDGYVTVVSMDSPGIVSLPMKTASGVTTKEGDVVLFCEFPDGDGLILALM